MNWETKIPLIFWHMRSLYYKKHPVRFRTQNFVVSLKTAYIEGSLPKRQLVECDTLWCNNVDKQKKINAWFYIAACLAPPTVPRM